MTKISATDSFPTENNAFNVQIPHPVAFRLMHRLLLLLLGLQAATITTTVVAREYIDLKAEPHLYWDSQPKDRFSLLVEDINSGKKSLKPGSPLEALSHLLEALEIPTSSQILVYSATSLQSGLITPDNPRALYFNEDTYIGYVPGGKLEVLSIDPRLGAIMYILDIPKQDGQLPYIDRSKRCMNCHSGDRMHFVPGLAIESVIADMTGATQEGFRRGLFGHTIPFEDRFGGWYVTGEGSIKKHLGNLVGDHTDQGLRRREIAPGELYSWQGYPVRTSDTLAHLLHEHQAGFVNMVVESIYRTRQALHDSKGKLTPEQQAILDEMAKEITSYVLFSDEAPLPAGGIPGDNAYKQAFLQNRKQVEGSSLKDLDLQNRLFRYRCSYMVYTELWDAMQPELKSRVYDHMKQALDGANDDFSYLGAEEKLAIRKILHQTKQDLPSNWLD